MRTAATRTATARCACGWLGVVALLELVARAIVYGLADSPGVRARALGGELGGPGFVGTLIVALTLGGLLSTGLVWLASMGVRERWALAAQPLVGSSPRVALRPLATRAAVLTLVGWLTFATIETTIHLRAGMGFHGLTCLIGPVHRNALPVIAGLALLASALVAAAGLACAWMRRTVARFLVVRPAARRPLAELQFTFASWPRRAPLLAATAPRGPPVIAA